MKNAIQLILTLLILNSPAQGFPAEEWLSNDIDPIWAEPNAPKGGVFRGYIPEFPPTFRIWGPYAHHPLRSLFSDNQLSLVSFHPNTGKPIPSLASEWFFHKNNKAISFRIHEDAKWSDSTPVTSQDFTFTKSFFISGKAKDPWFKSFYHENIESIKAIDSKTLYIEANQPMDKQTLIKVLNLRPLPKHFYSQPEDNLIKTSQWRVEPNTGPYILSGYSFGDELIFRRKTEWWGKSLKYNLGRYNVDTVVYKVYQTRSDVRKAFAEGFIDYYRSTASHTHSPQFASLIERGAAHHFIFNHKENTNFNGILINPQGPILSDINVRRALSLGLSFEKPDTAYQPITHLLKNNAIESNTHNPFDAKRILTQAGWLRDAKTDIRQKDSQALVLELVFDNRISQTVVAHLIENANEIGIKINAFPLTPTQLQTYLVNKVFDLALLAFDQQHFDQTTFFNNEDFEKPGNWAFFKSTPNKYNETYDIAKQYLAIPAYSSAYSYGYHWRWIVFPKVPSTRSAKHLYQPFAGGGQFWIDRAFLIETRTNRRKSFRFEKAIQVFD
ncbi:hypothetical protein HF888_08365 [Bermanella marisrubri]|uniref:Putative binding protein component ofABC transporter n=1 Tax=Bermanella marisrubri TaxID=207949 RepID=Q1MXK9_9GAMM|nr:ABC transporter substrate-binding protein [Bermanella marisrubri]EAT10704.1 putative binding protein component ofABC transporter [Oceanobacter sp. RED65] [Bermanella marisrubri]QIZ84240.1 hypothetical protein HF888_08365 [Bermanella marisrubri]